LFTVLFSAATSILTHSCAPYLFAALWMPRPLPSRQHCLLGLTSSNRRSSSSSLCLCLLLSCKHSNSSSRRSSSLCLYLLLSCKDSSSSSRCYSRSFCLYLLLSCKYGNSSSSRSSSSSSSSTSCLLLAYHSIYSSNSTFPQLQTLLRFHSPFQDPKAARAPSHLPFFPHMSAVVVAAALWV